MLNDHAYLYVEDDPFSRNSLDLVFRRMLGVERMWVFEDSCDFMKRLSDLPEKPDFFLLDIHMKPYTGFQLLDMLRADPDYSDAIVIALTASVMNEEIELLRQSGFDGAIGKPIDVDVFPDLLRRVLDGEKVWYVST